MDMYILITFIMITLVNAISGQVYRRHFWQSSYPGELLNALDSMTFGDIKSPTSTELTIAHNYPSPIPTPSPVRRTEIPYGETSIKTPSSSEDSSATSKSAEADDYEREYEQFVRNYFDDAADHYLSNDNDDDNSNESAEVSNLSSDVSYENDKTELLDAVPYASSSKSATKAGKKCRKERRKREICVICKNLRNGERSETCSYERGSDPEKYTFETQRKYRKTRARDNSSDDGVDDDAEDNAQDESSEETFAESKLKNKMVKPEKASTNSTTLSSSCIKRIINGKSCFYCKDALGMKALKCFTLNPQVKKEKEIPLKIKEKTHQKKRIYKRTLSYVYEKGLDSNGTLPLPDESNGNFIIPLE